MRQHRISDRRSLQCGADGADGLAEIAGDSSVFVADTDQQQATDRARLRQRDQLRAAGFVDEVVARRNEVVVETRARARRIARHAP